MFLRVGQTFYYETGQVYITLLSRSSHASGLYWRILETCARTGTSRLHDEFKLPAHWSIDYEFKGVCV